jgi:hypothetical protein
LYAATMLDVGNQWEIPYFSCPSRYKIWEEKIIGVVSIPVGGITYFHLLEFFYIQE